MLQYKDKTLFSEINEESSVYTLYNGKKLGQALEFLPNGRINKTETGIGATTLELESKRNSIIVQPLKVTAHNKSLKDTSYFYFGGKIGSKKTPTTIQQLKNYISDPNIQHKKILVVADSLSTVVEIIGNNVYTEYFLLIDEVDTIQTDSTYRGKMETCIEYYKLFEPTKRALVSATLLNFSDPELSKEPLTVFKYDKSTDKSINFIHTGNIEGVAFDTIQEAIKKIKKTDRLVIAYNSVSGCLSITKTLVKNGLCKPDEVKILCSKSDANTFKLQQYYSELDQEVFPVRINFTTSAYFNGFDIEEDYHLIIISDVVAQYKMLSEHDIVQISGRCRKQLLSLHVIHNSYDNKILSGFSRYTQDELITAANKQIQTINCINHTLDNDRVLIDEIERIRNLIISAPTKQTFKFLRKDKVGNVKLSYLNIDAFIETERVRFELYNTPTSLGEALVRKGYKPHFKTAVSSTELEAIEKEKANYPELASEVVTMIRNTPDNAFTRDILDDPNVYGRTGQILELYYKYKDQVDKVILQDLLEKHGASKSSKDLIKLAHALFYFTLTDDDDIVVNVKNFFPIDAIMDTKTLNDKVSKLFKNTKLFPDIDTKTAITVLKTWVHISATTVNDKINKKKISVNKVKGYNPFGLKRDKVLIQLL